MLQDEETEMIFPEIVAVLVPDAIHIPFGLSAFALRILPILLFVTVAPSTP